MCLSAAFLVAGCGKNPDTAVQPSSPLESFQQIIGPCTEALAEPKPDRVWQPESGAHWMRAVYSPYSIKYDVKRTDSLVSPVVGFLEISSQTVLITRDSETEVRSASIDKPEVRDMLMTDIYVISVALQNGTWKLQSITSASQNSAGGGITTSPSPIDEQALLRAIPSSAACVPQG